MHIRKLELQGFKSFADRASFQFGPGISGVVGPNGCGKSNVVDAVKWCLGEQSAKSLRGEAMQDVIFAGSSQRAAVGFAEVTLGFDAGDEPFPGVWARFSQLEVTRRLYRDGQSEYLVNQDRVRLRDIHELFMDTGVGNQLYSVIEQGRIGLIVHARPEQRRTLIEEAAGISKYKARREETMEKLGSTRASLERVSDLAEELGRQLRASERAVQRVGRWRALTARARQEEIALGLVRCAALVGDRRALSDQTRRAQEELDEAGRAVARHEEELAVRRAGLDALEEESGRARDRLAEVEAQRRVEESAAQYQAREAEESAARLLKLARDHEAARDERVAAEAEARAAREAAGVAEAGLARARTAADEQGAALRAAEDAARATRAGLEAARARSLAAFQEAARAKAQQASLVARRQALAQREERNREAARAAGATGAHVSEEIARLADRVKEAEVAVADARKRLDAAHAEARRATDAAQAEGRRGVDEAQARAGAALDMAQAEAKAAVDAAQAAARTEVDALAATARIELDEARAALGVAEAAVVEARREVERRTEALTEATRARAALRARAEALEDMDRRGEGVPDGLRAALAVPGTLGLLGSLLDVPEAEEALIARAVDGALDAVLVPDAETAARVAAAVGKGGARVLVAPDVAVEGIAARVGGSEPARRALSALLAGVEGVGTVAEALHAWRPGRRVVTRDDALVRADGVIVLGRDEGAGAAALRRRREVAALRAEIDAVDVSGLAGEVEAAKGSLAAAETARVAAAEAAEAVRAAGAARVEEARAAGAAKVEAARAGGAAAVEAARSRGAAEVETARAGGVALLQKATADGAAAQETARNALRTAEGLMVEARHRLNTQEAERQRASQASSAAEKEALAIAGERASIDGEATRVEAVVAEAEARHVAAEEELRERRGELERLEPAVARLTEEVQRLRLEAAGHQKDLAAAQAAAAGASERAERAAGRAVLVERERGDLETRRVVLAQEAEATARRLQELGEAQGRVHAELEAARERVRDERDRVRASEASAKAARDRRDACKDRAVELEAKLAEVRAALERVRGDTEEKHGVSLPGLLDRLDRDGQVLLDGHEPEGDALGAEPVPVLRVVRGDLDDDPAPRAARVAELREALGKLGEVNPAAEEEWREVKARHDEIDRQRVDLVEAMDIIEKAIAKINRTCRERFRETFDLVSAHFAEIYPRLVGGGSGRLELTDEEDLLTCGVELAVQPPGKRVQNLSLLSGGEKAMAAIGLIFSLFRVKPSPFCLLDEVDAPLDEGNGARFNDMLKEMSRISQFIVITHNKKTMECADVLYGVTMPEPGASRLVTVRID